MQKPLKHIFICINKRSSDNPKGCCSSKGGEEVRKFLKDEINKRGLKEKIMVSGSTCLGHCKEGPIMVIYPEGRWFERVNLSNIEQVIKEII